MKLKMMAAALTGLVFAASIATAQQTQVKTKESARTKEKKEAVKKTDANAATKPLPGKMDHKDAKPAPISKMTKPQAKPVEAKK